MNNTTKLVIFLSIFMPCLGMNEAGPQEPAQLPTNIEGVRHYYASITMVESLQKAHQRIKEANQLSPQDSVETEKIFEKKEIELLLDLEARLAKHDIRTKLVNKNTSVDPITNQSITTFSKVPNLEVELEFAKIILTYTRLQVRRETRAAHFDDPTQLLYGQILASFDKLEVLLFGKKEDSKS